MASAVAGAANGERRRASDLADHGENRPLPLDSERTIGVAESDDDVRGIERLLGVRDMMPRLGVRVILCVSLRRSASPSSLVRWLLMSSISISSDLSNNSLHSS